MKSCALRRVKRAWHATAAIAISLLSALPISTPAYGADLMYGDTVVLSKSGDNTKTSNCGWFGCRVIRTAMYSDGRSLTVAHGGEFPTAFYIRPAAEPRTANRCVKYNDSVHLATTSAAENTSNCGWYGCRVLTHVATAQGGQRENLEAKHPRWHPKPRADGSRVFAWPKMDHGTAATALYLRNPKPNERSDNRCIQVGDPVTVSLWSENRDHGDGEAQCGWYGCTVLTANDDIVYFGPGGKVPDQFHLHKADLDPEFVMVIASDPQLGYCEDYCKTKAKTSLTANQWFSDSIKTIQEDKSINFGGIIINGDLRNEMHRPKDFDFLNRGRRSDEDLNMAKNFDDLYLRKLGDNNKVDPDRRRIFLGLGNHDYINDQDAACVSESIAIIRYGCAANNIKWFLETVKLQVDIDPDWQHQTVDEKNLKLGGKGSLAYAWDIGRYHFVQLNWMPNYTNKFRLGHIADISFDLTSPFEWLKRHLSSPRLRDQRVIINVHHATGPAENTDEEKKTARGKLEEEFQRFVLDTPNVHVVFQGHYHMFFGAMIMRYDTKPFDEIISRDETDNTVWSAPGRMKRVFYSGSAETNRYLKVRFGRSDITVQVINSENGKVVEDGPPMVVRLPK